MMQSMKAVINTIMGAMDGLIWTLGLLVPGPLLQPVHGPTAQPLEVPGLGPQPVHGLGLQLLPPGLGHHLVAGLGHQPVLGLGPLEEVQVPGLGVHLLLVLLME